MGWDQTDETYDQFLIYKCSVLSHFWFQNITRNSLVKPKTGLISYYEKRTSFLKYRNRGITRDTCLGLYLSFDATKKAKSLYNQAKCLLIIHFIHNFQVTDSQNRKWKISRGPCIQINFIFTFKLSLTSKTRKNCLSNISQVAS